jgi:hypothetical protein
LEEAFDLTHLLIYEMKLELRLLLLLLLLVVFTAAASRCV